MQPPRSDVDSSPRFVCVEITSNWPQAWPAQDMADKLQAVVNGQAERGYKLHSWNGWAVATSGGVVAEAVRVTETIVAVFERAEETSP